MLAEYEPSQPAFTYTKSAMSAIDTLQHIVSIADFEQTNSACVIFQ